MRNFLIIITGLFIITAGSFAGEQKVVRLSEPVAQTADYETFGALLDESVPMVQLEDVSAGDHVGKQVRVSARVSQVCQKKGCFFIAQDGAAVVRISFVDYSFFVPTDISGKQVTFVGEVVAVERTEEQAEHFAEDMGDSEAAVAAGETYEIVASSVRVPRG